MFLVFFYFLKRVYFTAFCISSCYLVSYDFSYKSTHEHYPYFFQFQPCRSNDGLLQGSEIGTYVLKYLL